VQHDHGRGENSVCVGVNGTNAYRVDGGVDADQWHVPDVYGARLLANAQPARVTIEYRILDMSSVIAVKCAHIQQRVIRDNFIASDGLFVFGSFKLNG
jgi:hypothetical protein